VYENALAAVEGGKHGFAFASGLAALTTIAHLLRTGDHVIRYVRWDLTTTGILVFNGQGDCGLFVPFWGYGNPQIKSNSVSVWSAGYLLMQSTVLVNSYLPHIAWGHPYVFTSALSFPLTLDIYAAVLTMFMEARPATSIRLPPTLG
jgi:cystathionine beta-lyase/cystathionine gamma-synthase